MIHKARDLSLDQKAIIEGLLAHEITAILNEIQNHAIWVKPAQRLHVCIDPNDDMVLDCARAGNAHDLVTGNIRHFPSSSARNRIVTAREFLEAVVLIA